MQNNKQRRRVCFTAVMAILATGFGSLIAIRMLRGQADVFSDLTKIALVIALGTVALAYVFWGLANHKTESKIRGLMAGVMTALCVVPLPVFIWSFKNEMISGFASPDNAVIPLVFLAVISAGKEALLSFTTIGGLAIPLSALVGYIIGHRTEQT